MNFSVIILNSGFRIPDSGFRFLLSGFRFPDSGFRISAFRVALPGQALKLRARSFGIFRNNFLRIYSGYSARIVGMEIQVFRNENSSQTNTNSHYSNYSYSGFNPKRTRPKLESKVLMFNTHQVSSLYVPEKCDSLSDNFWLRPPAPARYLTTRNSDH